MPNCWRRAHGFQFQNKLIFHGRDMGATKMQMGKLLMMVNMPHIIR